MTPSRHGPNSTGQVGPAGQAAVGRRGKLVLRPAGRAWINGREVGGIRRGLIHLSGGHD